MRTTPTGRLDLAKKYFLQMPIRAFLLAVLVGVTAAAGSEHHHHPIDRHAAPSAPAGISEIPLIEVPEAHLIDHHGRDVELRELVAGRRVAMNFIFTSCTTVCPPMGALFARLQQDLLSRGEDDIIFLSISIDPVTDTPERLAAWADPFAGSPEWRLLTGEKTEVDRLLKRLGVFSALIEDHAPLILLGNEPEGRWLRAYGLAPPADLARALAELDGPPGPATEPPGAALSAAAREYFTDTVLLDQNGRERRFYTDLIAGKTVVINPFFATCTGSCPVMHRALARVQQALGARLGRDVHMLSITVDPEHDTPEVLSRHAAALGAGQGWHFLTGEPANVRHVLERLGQFVEQKEAHQSIFLVGNDRTGLWQKAFGLDSAERFLEVVQAVADDAGQDEIQIAAGPSAAR